MLFWCQCLPQTPSDPLLLHRTVSLLSICRTKAEEDDDAARSQCDWQHCLCQHLTQTPRESTIFIHFLDFDLGSEDAECLCRSRMAFNKNRKKSMDATWKKKKQHAHAYISVWKPPNSSGQLLGPPAKACWGLMCCVQATKCHTTQAAHNTWTCILVMLYTFCF